MNKNTWQWLVGTVVTLITSVATVLLAFPSVVERFLNTVLDKVSVVSFDKALRRQSVIDEISAFDLKHHAYSAVVEIMPDFGFKVIWLNPNASHFWLRKGFTEGGIEYPKFAILNRLRENHCIGEDLDHEPVFACSILGRHYVIVSYPRDNKNLMEFKIDLGLLASRIDRHFVGIQK